MERRFLVTGAYGCIGAWVVRDLLGRGEQVVTFDIGGSAHRIAQVVPPEQAESFAQVQADVTDLDALERGVAVHEITNLIHLAALQVPFCRADPPLGARVNVVGTVNVFEAVTRRGGIEAPVVYASSIAAYDAIDGEAAAGGMSSFPGSIYGVYKRANEATARLYHAERGVPSVGLRPHTVYGVGRDQGMT